MSLFELVRLEEIGLFTAAAIVAALIGVIVSVVWVETAQRKIPVQYAKRVVGRRMYGGSQSYLPLKVDQSGVIAVIFAVSLLAVPLTLAQFWPQSPLGTKIMEFGNRGSWAYDMLYGALIIFFCYFYNSVSINPEDLAENLKKSGGFIPGIRPGAPTVNYIEKVLERITLGGALFVVAIAILPDVFSDLDDYQKKIESDWEHTKNDYKNKIDHILDDFMAQHPGVSKPTEPLKSAPKPTGGEPVSDIEQRMERLLSRVERTLTSGEERPFLSGWRRERPSIINIGWDASPTRYNALRKKILIAAAVALSALAIYTHFLRVPTTTPLPYIHPSTIAFVGDKVYIVEWFRKALYEHRFAKGFPIVQVENIPNNFLSGVAFSDKYLWTLDAFGHQFIQHSLGSDHRVLKSFPTPGSKPAGLYWDGTDIWSADLGEKKKVYIWRTGRK
jgi:hypothetical protein